MRMSREAMAEHHREIVAAGARMLRERGIEGVSVAELMQSAGLTHGGFYRHFASKDAFVREAVTHAFAQVAAMRDDAAARSDGRGQLKAWIAYYLSDKHRRTPGYGCPIAALGPEIRRASDAVREGFAAGVDGVIDWIAERLEGTSENPRDTAAQLLSMMVGAVVTARLSNRPEDVLAPARSEASRLVEQASDCDE